MSLKVHPTGVSSVTSKELREIQKLHELGKKYWPAADKRRYEKEESRPEPRRSRYLFRHPYSRLITAYLVVFCNFLIFAEDPVSHSYRECIIDVIGDIYTFIFIRWPRGSFSLIKFSCWMFAILLGMCVGKWIIHGWFFCKKLKLKMFTEDGQGSWMVMFLTALFSLFCFSFAYNGFLMLEGKYMDKMHASNRMGMENQTFMKVAAICTWLGDFITAWMVTDMMLQGAQYAHWAPALRRFWKQGLNRVYAFWFVFVSMTIVVSTAISTDYVNWDKVNRDFVASNELARAFLASFILVMDLMIVMQDWDFPHFAGSLDIKLPGVNSDAFDVRIPGCCGGKPLDIYITGKWFNYGIIFIVMILDLNMWKNQIFYEPFAYGQYTDSEGYIYSVSDRQFLRWGNRTLMTYEWRWNHINPKTNGTYGLEDLRMNAKYKGYSLTLKSIAFVPSILAFCVFGYLLWLFGLEENPDEVLVRRYRRDVRHHRQMKRLRKKKRMEERKNKAMEEGEERVSGLLCSWTTCVFSKLKPACNGVS
ncbi:transmembrane protein 117-like [Orbicella faveolata]|uniref:transmembrane protein 117-like n=1 Tax=Orbicella faveolata TaxID=48498 RepID=UPI0009E438CE|nr:transmembrane protein 117-like [Orbicella faveolata]